MQIVGNFVIYVKMVNILLNNVHENVKRMMSSWRGCNKCGISRNVSGFKKENKILLKAK
jgi:hypothetical protein